MSYPILLINNDDQIIIKVTVEITYDEPNASGKTGSYRGFTTSDDKKFFIFFDVSYDSKSEKNIVENIRIRKSILENSKEFEDSELTPNIKEIKESRQLFAQGGNFEGKQLLAKFRENPILTIEEDDTKDRKTISIESYVTEPEYNADRKSVSFMIYGKIGTEKKKQLVFIWDNVNKPTLISISNTEDPMFTVLDGVNYEGKLLLEELKQLFTPNRFSGFDKANAGGARKYKRRRTRKGKRSKHIRRNRNTNTRRR
jgi:hypothetical protein